MGREHPPPQVEPDHSSQERTAGIGPTKVWLFPDGTSTKLSMAQVCYI